MLEKCKKSSCPVDIVLSFFTGLSGLTNWNLKFEPERDVAQIWIVLENKHVIVKWYFSFDLLLMRHSLLVNSDTAVSIAHRVFLVGWLCCHIKERTSLHWLSCRLLVKTWQQRYFRGETQPQPIPQRWASRKAEHTPLPSLLSALLIALWSYWHFGLVS